MPRVWKKGVKRTKGGERRVVQQMTDQYSRFVICHFASVQMEKLDFRAWFDGLSW